MWYCLDTINKKVKKMNLEDLELTIRSHGGLTKAGVTTVEQLITLEWSQLSKIKNIGSKSLSEISWECVQLLNGKMTERRLQWEKNWPAYNNNKETHEKAKKYDAIKKITG
jgi:DNA-directed RNA polymerase alpha subunit